VERELTVRPRRSPVIGVVMVPPWRAGLEVSVLPQEYRDLLEVAEDAGRSLRAAQIAAAAGLSTDRGKVETLRSKLKRLTERGWLAEDAGLFALPARDGDGAGDTPHTRGHRLDSNTSPPCQPPATTAAKRFSRQPRTLEGHSTGGTSTSTPRPGTG